MAERAPASQRERIIEILQAVPERCIERHYGPTPHHDGCLTVPDYDAMADALLAAREDDPPSSRLARALGRAQDAGRVPRELSARGEATQNTPRRRPERVVSHLNPLPGYKCRRCHKRATCELVNDRSAVIGYYCAKCGAKALYEFQHPHRPVLEPPPDARPGR
jgi:hypothetical protein